MIVTEADLAGAIEGVVVSSTRIGLATFQEMQAKRFWIQVQRNLLNTRLHLYGLFLAILTRKESAFQSLLSLAGDGNILCMDDVMTLVQICQNMVWVEGILCLLNAAIVK